MAFFREMKIVDLVEVLEKCQPALKKKIFKDWEPKWPSIEKLDWLDWDIWTRLDEQRKGRECIIPDIPRTYHFSVGSHVSESFQKRYFQNKSLNHQTGIRFDRSKLTKSGYEKTLTDLITAAKVIDHSKKPCVDNDFIPTTTSSLFVVYIKCRQVADCVTWLKIAKCFRIWDQNVRGYHQGVWRLWIKGSHVVFVSNLSPHFKHKPLKVVPLEL